MIRRTITTPIATGPILLIIVISEKWSTAAGDVAGVAACHMKMNKPSAFVPRRLVRIVTVNPPKGFSYIDELAGTPQNEPAEARTARNLRSLLSHEIVRDDACYFNGLSRYLGGRKPRPPGSGDGYRPQ